MFVVSLCLLSDALLQHLPSHLGFSYLGSGVSLYDCSSKAQLLLLTLDEGYLLQAAPPDLESGVAPLGPPMPAQQLLLGAKDGEALQSAKTRPGVDCGSDYQLPIAKFRLKLKKVGKTTRLYRYDVNKIPYDYLVEVTNRFKGLDLVDRVLKNYRWRFVPLYRRW